MPASLQNLPDLNTIFSLDCFHFNDLKKVLAVVIDNLGDLQDKYNTMNIKIGSLDIPDVSLIMTKISALEKGQFECERGRRGILDNLESFKMNMTTSLDDITSQITALTESDESLDARVTALEQDVENLKNRPMAKAGGDLDISMLAGRDEFESLRVRVASTEKRNLEQDERLTNYEIRISKLEEMISQPMDRIIKLEQTVESLSF